MSRGIEWFLTRTLRALKLDIDTENEFYKLKSIFNFLHLFPDAEITLSSSRAGYHLRAGVPSNLDVRRACYDCRGRVYLSEIRGGDIIFQQKGKYKLKRIRGELVPIFTRAMRADRIVTLFDILHKPFFAKFRPHAAMRRRKRKWKYE